MSVQPTTAMATMGGTPMTRTRGRYAKAQSPAVSPPPQPDNPSAWRDRFEEVLRLTTLNSSLMGDISRKDPEETQARERKITELKTIRNAATDGSSPETFLEEIAGKTNTCVRSFFEASKETLNIEQVRRDLDTIAVAGPLQKTKNGNCGPTLLISYLRTKEKAVAGVLKWTNLIEVESHEIYEAFSTGFNGKSQNHNDFFSVPRMVSFDLASKNTDPVIVETLNQLIANYRQPVDSCKPEFGNHVVIHLEKIKGQNFPDFINMHYASLPENVKASLFRRLGKLAYLDFVLGHNDRLLPISSENPSFTNIMQNEANLDNLMVCKTNDGFQLFAIDNGINATLADAKHKDSYNNLIQKTLSSPDFHQLLASAITTSIINFFRECPPGKGAPLFQKDLEQHTTDLQSGIITMDLEMTHSLIPSWRDNPPKHLGIASVCSERLLTAQEASQSRTSTTPDQRILWAINEHCSGSQEDIEFFKQGNFSLHNPNPAIQNIIHLVSKIPSTSTEERGQAFLDLKTAVNHLIHPNNTPDSPPRIRTAPTPSKADTPIFDRSFHDPKQS